MDPGRSDAPGKVLKDRRPPRERGRMGTSVTRTHLQPRGRGRTCPGARGVPSRARGRALREEKREGEVGGRRARRVSRPEQNARGGESGERDTTHGRKFAIVARRTRSDASIDRSIGDAVRSSRFHETRDTDSPRRNRNASRAPMTSSMSTRVAIRQPPVRVVRRGLAPEVSKKVGKLPPRLPGGDSERVSAAAAARRVAVAREAAVREVHVALVPSGHRAAAKSRERD
eukprot:30837-Pelagococcus_subviridis.AAC.11